MLKCNMKQCTGCGMCNRICPKGAISMEENKDGFIYPKVDKNKCVDCNLCNKCCPALEKKINKEVKKGFAVQLRDKETLKKCASGGAFAGVAKAILQKGGIVFGVASICNSLEYIKIEKEEELNKILGSKYYQCNITESIYKEIEKSTKKNKVLVSGTPCQISAFKNNTKINQENLITFEILCQGVPSRKVISYFDTAKEKNKNKKIKNHVFRSKDKYIGRNYLNKYEYEDGEVEYFEGENDLLSLTFQRQIFLRESCYNCRYSNENRVADFTGGDLWNYDLKNTNIDFKNGVSILVCNNAKSIEFFKQMSEFEYEDIDYELALKDNIPYHRSVKKPFSRKYSYKLLNLELKPSLITYICCFKYYIKKILKKVVKQ